MPKNRRDAAYLFFLAAPIIVIAGVLLFAVYQSVVMSSCKTGDLGCVGRSVILLVGCGAVFAVAFAATIFIAIITAVISLFGRRDWGLMILVVLALPGLLPLVYVISFLMRFDIPFPADNVVIAWLAVFSLVALVLPVLWFRVGRSRLKTGHLIQ